MFYHKSEVEFGGIYGENFGIKIEELCVNRGLEFEIKSTAKKSRRGEFRAASG